MSRGLDESDAEENAVQQIGTPDELVRSVIETSGGLKMVAFLKRHFLAAMAVLAAPGLLLLGLSFLTFNFTCREVTFDPASGIHSFTYCGVPALGALRPVLSDVGLYGGPSWLKWSIHILAVAGPFFATLLIIRSQLSLRRRQAPEETVEIALALDRTHMLALAGTLSIFLTVVAYKAAG
jgi:hypothetical protein